MPVSSTLVTQYYQGILRQTPTTATVNQLANSADLSALTSALLSQAGTAVDPVVRLYQAAFGRVPDSTGLNNIVNLYSNNALGNGTYSLLQIAGQFTGSPEFLNRYGADTTNNSSNTAFVAALYVNVLNRTMGATEGQGWINLLNAGTSRAAVLQGFSESPEFISVTSTAVDNFLTSAGAGTNSYTGNLFYYGGATTANTFTLTINSDLFNGNPGYNVFNALTTSTANTLNNGDSITGGEGVNTLNVGLIDTSNVTPLALNRIQNINVTANADATATLDLSNAPSIAYLTVQNVTGANTLTINNVQSSSTNFTLADVKKNVTLDVANTAVTGTADTILLTAKGIASGTLSIDSGFETANITSSSYSANVTTNTINTGFAGAINLNDGGQGTGAATATTLRAADGSSALTSTNVNASNLTGTLDVSMAAASTFTGGSGNTTVTSAGGADTIRFGNATNTLIETGLTNLSANATVVGGSGVDTLRFSAIVNDSTADSSFTKISNFNTLQLADATNSIGVSTNFFTAAGFSQITGGASADTMIVYGATGVTATISGGADTDLLQLTNTAGGTFTLINVETVGVSAAGTQADTINLSTSGAAVGVDLGAGTDTININTGQFTTLTISNVEVVNGNATTGNQVILANDNVAVTINGGSAGLTVNANNQATAGNSFLFGAGNDRLIVASLGGLSNDATVVGGSGTDTLQLSTIVRNTTADGNFGRVATFDTLQLADATNSIGVSTNFFTAAGFSQITGGASADTMIVYGATGITATITGGAGDDFVQVTNTAGGTLTFFTVETVTSSNAGVQNDTYTIGNSASTISMAIDMGAGTSDTLINLNTGGTTTLLLSGVETYTGGMVIDAITLTNTNSSTVVNGGGNADVITLLSGVGGNYGSFTQAGNTGAMSIVGVETLSETATISGVGTYRTTSVETLTVSSGTAVNLTANILLATSNSTYSQNLANANTATFTFSSGATTGGFAVLSVNATTGSQTITFNSLSNFAEETANVLVLAGGGYDVITLATGGPAPTIGAVNETIQINLANVASGTNTANSFVITNFGSSTGTDTINLTGATLKNANGASIILNTNTISASGLGNTNSFTTGLGTGTFITGSSAILGNLASTNTQTGVIFQLTGVTSLTGAFTTQTGIDQAVTYITTNIGASGTVANQNAIIIVNDQSSNNALFQFTESGAASGISASELKLIGVTTGTLTNASFS